MPIDALASHLSRRGLPATIQEQGPALVTDVLETGPISLLLSVVPVTEDVRPADLFTLPHYRPLLRTATLGAADTLTIDP